MNFCFDNKNQETLNINIKTLFFMFFVFLSRVLQDERAQVQIQRGGRVGTGIPVRIPHLRPGLWILIRKDPEEEQIEK